MTTPKEEFDNRMGGEIDFTLRDKDGNIIVKSTRDDSGNVVVPLPMQNKQRDKRTGRSQDT